MASEMLYPVMPVYLSSIGFSVVFIGILEGFAEATAGLSKGYFGNLSDRWGKRLPFVQWGYALSAVSKPLMAFFVFPVWVFLARTVDRLGKGMRTGARDAMLSAEATSQTKARVFGFHRSMDTLGAVIGPLLALCFLYFYPGKYQLLFLLAFVPGLAAVSLLFLVREKRRNITVQPRGVRFFDFFRYWKSAPSTYRRLVLALLVFTLFNSSDLFLLLKIKNAGYSDQMVITMYIFYNLVYSLFSYPLGVLADRFGMKKIFIAGLFLYACVYAGMANATSEVFIFFMFFLYGVYAAATEGIAKSWITNMVPDENAATAIGTFTAGQSIASMLASTLAGMIWYCYGPAPAFLLTSVMAISVALFMGLRLQETSGNE